MARKIVARLIVVVLFGIVIGYAVGKSLAKDATRGRDLTLKEYVADFESHKKDLITSDMPMALSMFVGVLMVVAFFAVYELLVFAVDRVLEAVDSRRNTAMQPGPRGPPGAPPW
jgi:hypothetical protein